jgi:hypothetical protein
LIHRIPIAAYNGGADHQSQRTKPQCGFYSVHGADESTPREAQINLLGPGKRGYRTSEIEPSEIEP